jgi:[ribosomal protein S18]-alanine N-acetyltransferase
MPDDAAVWIRPAVLADLPALFELEQVCFANPWSEDSLRYDLGKNPNACYLAAISPDGTLAGYAAYWRAADEGMITNIAVAPAWRSQKVGTHLLASLIRVAAKEELTCMTLEVRPSNLAACRLYESAGFAAIGIRRGYYADNGEDAIIMFKKIVKIDGNFV